MPMQNITNIPSAPQNETDAAELKALTAPLEQWLKDHPGYATVKVSSSASVVNKRVTTARATSAPRVPMRLTSRAEGDTPEEQLAARGIDAEEFVALYPDVKNAVGMLCFANAIAENNAACALDEDGKWPAGIVALIFQMAVEQSLGAAVVLTSESADGYTYSTTVAPDVISTWVARLTAASGCSEIAYFGVPSDSGDCP